MSLNEGQIQFESKISRIFTMQIFNICATSIIIFRAFATELCPEDNINTILSFEKRMDKESITM